MANKYNWERGRFNKELAELKQQEQEGQKRKRSRKPKEVWEEKEKEPKLKRRREKVQNEKERSKDKEDEEFFDGFHFGVQQALKTALKTGGAMTGHFSLFPVGPSLWERMLKDYLSPLLGEEVKQKGGLRVLSIKTKEQLEDCCSLFGTGWYFWNKFLQDVGDDHPEFVGTVSVSLWKTRVIKRKNKAYPSPFTFSFQEHKCEVKISFHFYYELRSKFVKRGLKTPEQLVGKQKVRVEDEGEPDESESEGDGESDESEREDEGDNKKI